MPTFPDVPNSAGVPSVPRNPLSPAQVVGPPKPAKVPGVVDASKLRPWSIKDATGKLALAPDNIVEVHFGEKSKVSDFPVEKGAFTTYNKAHHPIAIKITMSVGSKLADRNTFLNALINLKRSTNLVNITIPEGVFKDYTLESYDFSRTEKKGQNMIIASCHFVNVVQTTSQISNTSLVRRKLKNPSAATKVDGGKAQPVQLTQGEIAFAKVRKRVP